MDLNNKSVVITGGFGGIGLAIGKKLLSKNISKLAIFDIQQNDECLQNLRTKCPKAEILFSKMDITNKEDIESSFTKVIEQFGCFDILVNSCGILNDQDPERTIAINLTGLINATLTGISYMDKSNRGKGGLIVNISSNYGLQPAPPIAIYSSTKYASIGFTLSLADEFYYNKTGISFIVICPGATESNLLPKLEGIGTLQCSDEIFTSFLGSVPQTADECAEHTINAIQQNKNGSIWLIMKNAMTEVTPPKFF